MATVNETGNDAAAGRPKPIRSTRDSFDLHDRPGARRITKGDNYFAIYDRYFGDRRDKPITMIEIGVQHGGSLQMWKRYFHPDSMIVGIDINPDCRQFEEPGVRVFTGDQADHGFLAEVVRQVGLADIILDDGSHISAHQIASFEYLFRHGLADDGVYVIEDCGTSYLSSFGGGPRKKGTFIRYSKDVVDRINHWVSGGTVKRNWQTDWIESVEFYGAVVAYRKKRMSYPPSLAVGSETIDIEARFSRGRFPKLITRLRQVELFQKLVRTNPFLWRLMKRFVN